MIHAPGTERFSSHAKAFFFIISFGSIVVIMNNKLQKILDTYDRNDEFFMLDVADAIWEHFGEGIDREHCKDVIECENKLLESKLEVVKMMFEFFEKYVDYHALVFNLKYKVFTLVTCSHDNETHYEKDESIEYAINKLYGYLSEGATSCRYQEIIRMFQADYFEDEEGSWYDLGKRAVDDNNIDVLRLLLRFSTPVFWYTEKGEIFSAALEAPELQKDALRAIKSAFENEKYLTGVFDKKHALDILKEYNNQLKHLKEYQQLVELLRVDE